MEVRIYSASKEYKLIKLIKDSLSGFKKGSYLARLFVLRGFKAKYKTSYVGFLWEIMPSLTTALVWIFLRGSGAVSSMAVSIPFPLFVIIGTIMWSLITDSINKPLGVFNEYTSIISKINIPKESLLLIGFYNILINYGIKLLLIVFMLFFIQVVPTVSILLFVPISILTIISFMCLGVIFMPFEYMLPDLGKVKNYFLMGLMYLTPVVYANPGSGLLSTIIKWNPLTYIIDGLRNSLTGGFVELSFFFGMLLLTIVLFFIALIVYRITVPIITERIGS